MPRCIATAKRPDGPVNLARPRAGQADGPKGPFVMITRSSFEELNYSLELKPAELQLDYASPRA